MSNRKLNAIITYLLDAIITNQEIPLTSSLPVEAQKDLHFAAELQKMDLSSESRIRQKLRNQLQQQAALQANAGQMLADSANLGQTQTRSTGAAFLSVGLGAAAVVMAALLIFFRSPKTPGASEPAPEKIQEISTIEMVS